MIAISQAAARISAVGETFNRQTRDLAVAADTAEGRIGAAERLLATQAKLLADTSDRASVQAKEAGEAFYRQTQELVAASASAKAQAETLTVNEIAARRASFLRASRLIIESLNSLAIDFSRTLDPSLSERILREFVGGDRGVFVRRLLRLNYGEAGTVIKRKFQDDPEFRKYVTDYLSQFERLLADAKDADPENILSATFLTADVGKLYMVLAGILGRKTG
ncbi:MAG: hypothetical protein HY057_04550 [Rhodospirillales bacterium]|nr:hypothetical protein [Rhodospirillales bacterium]